MSTPSSPPEIVDATAIHALPSMAWESLGEGAMWLDCYRIGGLLPDAVAAKCFKAVELSTGKGVIIRGLRVTDDRRNKTWRKLSEAAGGGWLEPLKVFEGEGRRIEISEAGAATTLRDWVGQRRLSVEELRVLIRALAESLQRLHDGGVVHLNLRPEHVHVIEEKGPRVVLGGLEQATTIIGTEHVVLHGNPFYAPPEAVGLFKHTGSTNLFAWDWWTLGRLVQELVLGRHVLGELLHRDVSRETEELLTRAETLLAEQEGTTRAGAVEHMPATVELEIVRLLRGLLASCRDGRWGFEEVQRWLAKEPVRDRYDLSRHDRLFERKGKLFTVPEAAELFGGAAAWDEGVESLFGRENPNGLRAFLSQNSAQAKAHQKLESALKLDESTALKNLPADVRRELVACAAWAQLAEGIAPARWRGQVIDATVIRAWLRDEAQPAGAARVRGVINHVLAQAIGAGDADTGRWLISYAHDFEAALAWTAARGRPVSSEAMELALLRSLFEPEDALERTHDGMKRLYACSRDAAVETFFKKAMPTKYERALVVFTGTDAAGFGYVTHERWREEKYEELRGRAQRMAEALYWVQLERALRAGPLIFGGMLWLGLCGAIPAGAALYAGSWGEGAMLGGGVVAIAFAMKAFWRLSTRPELEKRLTPGETWGFFDGAARCRREAQRIVGSREPVKAHVLKESLDEANAEIAKLGFEPARAPVAGSFKPVGTWALAVISWLLLFTVLGVSGVRVRERVMHSDELIPALAADANDVERGPAPRRKVEPWEIKAKKDAAAEAAVGTTTPAVVSVDETQQTIVKVAWPFKPSQTALTVRVRGFVDASADQLAAAEVSEKELKQRYDEKTINVMVAVRVPTASGFGLMLYDGKAGKFTNRTVYEIAFNPLARTWLEIGGVRAFYLGAR